MISIVVIFIVSIPSPFEEGRIKVLKLPESLNTVSKNHNYDYLN